ITAPGVGREKAARENVAQENAGRSDMSQNEFALVVKASREEALRLKCQFIDTAHLMLGILTLKKGRAIRALKNLGVDLRELKKAIEEKTRIPGGSVAAGNMPLTD